MALVKELHPFRYRDALTGRWSRRGTRRRARTSLRVHAEWEIIGPAELRSPVGGAFNPYWVVPHAEFKRLQEPAPQINPHLDRPPAVDAVECFLTVLLLRRYVTYCARRRRYAQMHGAARLYGEIVATIGVFGRLRSGWRFSGESLGDVSRSSSLSAIRR